MWKALRSLSGGPFFFPNSGPALLANCGPISQTPRIGGWRRKTINVMKPIDPLLQLSAVMLLLACTTAAAVPVPLDVADNTNGITDIYSATFDPPLNPNCAGAPDPDACAFFGGQPPASRAITIVPNPTTIANGAPRGITPQPADGSFLDVALDPGRTQVTLNGGVIYVPSANIVINQGQVDETSIQASDIGIVLQPPAPLSAPLDANGVALLQIDGAPSTVADFSSFSVVVDSCTGPLCGLVSILTLDMVRFRLMLDYDPDFTSFSGAYTGQTANNSLVFMTLNSIVVAPEIDVTDSVPPPADLAVAFGQVELGQAAVETVTVRNSGNADLLLGAVAAADPLVAPFSVRNDMCSNQSLPPAASCTFQVECAPAGIALFNDTLDIPSNDLDEPVVTVSLSCEGVPTPVPDIAVSDNQPPPDDLQLPFGDVTEGGFADALVTVRNAGNADLVLGSIGVIDPVAAPFSVILDNCSGQTVAPSGNCDFTVRFAPGTTGGFADSVDIPSNDPDEASVIVDMSGTGVPVAVPDITVLDGIAPMDDRMLPFPDTPQNFTVTESVTVVNDGTADLLIGNIAQADPLAAPFALLSDACSNATLSPLASCTIDLAFTPGSLTSFNDSFDIPSNDPDEPSVTLSLSGTGVPAESGERLPLEPSGADGGPFGSGLGLGSLAGLALLAGLRWRRRRR